MSNPKHTPEPWDWAVSDIDGKASIYHNGPLAYLGDAAEPGDGAANAARIVACVNGCAGIPRPEVMVPALIRALDAMVREHDGESSVLMNEMRLLLKAVKGKP